MVTLTECLKVFIAEAYQSIPMSDEKASHLSKLNHFHQPVKLLALVVQATADILHPLIHFDAVILAIGLKSLDLID